MRSYVVLNWIVLIILAVTFIVRKPAIIWKRFWILLIAMTCLTIIFDNLIISLHIVAYNPQHLIGIHLGKMPIEDLAYTIGACLLVPLLWGKDTHVT